MSVRTLNKVAVERDKQALANKAVAKASGDAKKEAEKKAEELKAESRSYLDYLVASIPTEPLALYTFLIAGIVSTIDSADDPERLLMRWIIFGVAAVFIPVWIVTTFLRRPAEERERTLPLAEVVGPVFAFGAWGLAMPESPLMAELNGDDKTVWTFIIIAAGVAVVALVSGSMTKEVKTKED